MQSLTRIDFAGDEPFTNAMKLISHVMTDPMKKAQWKNIPSLECVLRYDKWNGSFILNSWTEMLYLVPTFKPCLR